MVSNLCKFVNRVFKTGHFIIFIAQVPFIFQDSLLPLFHQLFYLCASLHEVGVLFFFNDLATIFFSASSEAECVLCGEAKDFAELIFCTSCGRHYHGRCLEPSVDLTSVIRMGWQCPDCKVCQGCRFVSTLYFCKPKLSTFQKMQNFSQKRKN